MGIEIGGHVERVDGKELSYRDFAERYLAKNKPVLLTGLTEDWRACKDWVNEYGEPNLKFFSTHFGQSKVQVADCSTKEFTDQKRTEMSVSEYASFWVQSSSEKQADDGKSLLYLKDWHFVKEYPDYIAYRTPVFFTDDWLNLYLDNYQMHDNGETTQKDDEVSCSDYRFVYMGPKGTWTPLHADVFRSYSWSANVCGKKRWLFLPPSQCSLLFDKYMKTSVYDIFDDINETRFPGFKNTIWLECLQEQNEIIFVPSGWFHQVHNLEDTISINHNWFNAYDLQWVWGLLLRDLKEAEEYIDDIKDICDDFQGLCQRNLAANTGMNFFDFFIFLAHICLANVFSLYSLASNSDFDIPKCGCPRISHHLAFNLASVRKISIQMKSKGGLAGNYGILDLKTSLEDPRFFELCMALGRIYSINHEEYNNAKNTLVIDLDKYRTQICTPEDLVQFIDYVMERLGFSCVEGNVMLPAGDSLKEFNN